MNTLMSQNTQLNSEATIIMELCSDARKRSENYVDQNQFFNRLSNALSC